FLCTVMFFIVHYMFLNISLRSFPTRRSSDLRDLDVHLQRGDARLGSGHLEIHVAKVVFVAQNIGQDGVFPVILKDKAHGHARDRDRKSTRLNSSHVKISYAVFCLKKKRKRKN